MNTRLQAAIAMALGIGSASLQVHAAPITVYAVDQAGSLLSFDRTTPGIIDSSTPIAGLASGEFIVGIDIRPGTGQLFGLSSASRLYTINRTTAAATQVGVDGAFTLSGASFGFDFNPVPDRIRIVSDADQNLRTNPNNGALAATDTMLAYGPADANAGANPAVVGSAYTNSFGPSPRTTPGTTLYGIDFQLDILVTQAPPNNGVLNTVGSLGVDVNDLTGFDIAYNDPSNTGLAAFSVGGTSSLYGINLATGAASPIGPIGGGAGIVAIAAAAVPEPGSLALLVGGAMGLGVLRRRRR